jgi:hypothetical protein
MRLRLFVIALISTTMHFYKNNRFKHHQAIHFQFSTINNSDFSTLILFQSGILILCLHSAVSRTKNNTMLTSILL